MDRAMAQQLPPLNALRAFEVAARHLSFTRAAAELNVTQAAVSHQIRGLEDWIGRPLFKRQARSLQLTAIGRQYLPAVRDAFEGLRSATAALLEADSTATLTVSTTASFAIKWLVPRLAQFQTAHPEIDVRLNTTIELVDFDRDGVDLAIRYGRREWPGLKSKRLTYEDMFPVCAPTLAAGPVPLEAPEDLARHTLLHTLQMRDDWRIWLTAVGVAGVDPTRGTTFDLAASAIEAAISGAGVALGRSALVAEDLAAGRLVAPFTAVVPTDAAYYVLTPEDQAPPPKVKAFRDWLLTMRDAEPVYSG